MARLGETASPSEDLTVPSLSDYAAEEDRGAIARLRRGRRGCGLLTGPMRTRPASTIPPGSKDATGALTDELREGLWAAIVSYLFAPASAADRWGGSVSAQPAIHRVWTSPPIGGPADDIPEDVSDLIEEWFSLATSGDVYALVECVLASLPDAPSAQFLTAVNLVLERGLSDHRFLGRRLLPIASRSDVATLEKALAACRAKKLAEPEANILAALDHLAHKPEPDALAVVHESIRAVQATAYALTKERPLDLDDALDILEVERPHRQPRCERATRGSSRGSRQNGREASRALEDARIILVTCAGFVANLAAKPPEGTRRSFSRARGVPRGRGRSPMLKLLSIPVHGAEARRERVCGGTRHSL